MSAEEASHTEAAIMTLARLFVARPNRLAAFGRLVPSVFETL